MKNQMTHGIPCILATALLISAWIPQANAQVQHKIDGAKISFEMQQTPKYEASGPKDKKTTALEWLEVEVELDVDTVNPSGYIDSLDADFYVGVKDSNQKGKPTLLTGKMTFVEVRAKEKKAWLSAYVSPAALAKATGSEKPGRGDVEAVAVVIKGAGLKEPIIKSEGPAGKWWESPALAVQDGLVLPKSKTPFAWLWSDRYPLTKDQ